MMGCGTAIPNLSVIQQDIENKPKRDVKDEDEYVAKSRQLAVVPIKTNCVIVCIIGCTHAGNLAAVTLRNLDPHLRIIVFEKNPVISFLSCGIHLAVNRTCSDLTKMFYNTPNGMRKMGIEIYPESAVHSIDYNNKLVNATVQSEKQQFAFDKLIIASGSAPIIPPIIEGLNFTGDIAEQIRGMKRVLLCKNFNDARKLATLAKPKRVCVIGAGLIGMEIAWAFNMIGSSVTVADHSERILHNYFSKEYTDVLESECKTLKMEMLMRSRVSKLSESEHGVTIVCEVQADSTIKTLQLSFDYVVLSIGFRANTAFALKTPNAPTAVKNVIFTDQQQLTSVPNVYAIGDCATSYNCILKKQTYLPLATAAIRHGLVAAYNIAGSPLPVQGHTGNTAVQLFDYSLASVGLQFEEARKAFKNIQIGRVVYSDFLYHQYCEKKVEKVVQNEKLAKFFNLYGELVKMVDQLVESFDVDTEETQDNIVSVTLVYDEKSTKILGGQAMGKQDITQQANAVSAAISQDLNMGDLAQLDLGCVDGDEKPWNVLGVAAASALVEVADFELQKDDE